MSKRQVIVFDGYVDPKPAGPPCEKCYYYPGQPDEDVLYCKKRDMTVINPLGTCNLWAEEVFERAEDVAEAISE